MFKGRTILMRTAAGLIVEDFPVSERDEKVGVTEGES